MTVPIPNYSGDRYSRSIGCGPIGWIPDPPVPELRYPAPTYDRHVRRSADDYAVAYQMLLPQGQAWPTWDLESNVSKWINGCAGIWDEVDKRADDMLVRESDPRMTVELLPDWERAFGLPDDCLAEPLTIADRQKALLARMTLFGGQSRQFFYDYASFLGLKIKIIEHSPWECGLSVCGDTSGFTDSGWPRWEIGNPLNRFFWTIAPYMPRFTWFRCGGTSELGKDHFLEIGLFSDAECIWNRLKPAHVELAYDYGNFVKISKYEGL